LLTIPYYFKLYPSTFLRRSHKHSAAPCWLRDDLLISSAACSKVEFLLRWRSLAKNREWTQRRGQRIEDLRLSSS